MAKTGLDQEDLLEGEGFSEPPPGESSSAQELVPGKTACISRAVSPRKVEDPTGAGDSFRGGLISGLVQGRTLEQIRPLGQRLRFLRGGVLRHPGWLPVQSRGIQRQIRPVFRINIHFYFLFLLGA